MATDLEIYNRVLRKLGDNILLGALGNAVSREEQQIKLVYDEVRRVVLGKYHWNFAITREQLTYVGGAETLVVGSEKIFSLPSDLIVLESVLGESGNKICNTQYSIETISGNRRLLYKGTGEVLYARYVFDCTDESKFTPQFTEAFVLRLAIDVCQSISGSAALLNILWQAYEMEYRAARDADLKQSHAYISRQRKPRNHIL